MADRSRTSLGKRSASTRLPTITVIFNAEFQTTNVARHTPVTYAVRDNREFVLHFIYSARLNLLLTPLNLFVTAVGQLVRTLLFLVFVHRSKCFVREHCLLALGASILLQLEDELIDFLSAAAHLALRVLRFCSHFVKFKFELGDLHVPTLNLVFFHSEEVLHVLIFVFQSNDRVTASLVFIK